ncbi:HD domain-containing protein [Bernardetia sp. OM2101]|uniref:HD domain-containing protein n=1 Tax=Bernardetia sp. OM2101 TaxID=3344876 RepID=UPI0035D0044D
MNNSTSTADLYRDALDFACKAHNEQKMPASELPYFLHISEVMTETLLAFQETNDKNLNQNLGVLVAILHDTVEDTSVTLEEIEKQFGKIVKNGVWAMTKDERLPKEEQMNDSLEKLLKEPIEVQFVKLADRIVNLKDPPYYWNLEKRQKYQKEAKIILEKLGKANLYLANRLSEKIREYEQYFV